MKKVSNLFKVNNKDSAERRQWHSTGVFVVNFEHISHLIVDFEHVFACKSLIVQNGVRTIGSFIFLVILGLGQGFS